MEWHSYYYLRVNINAIKEKISKTFQKEKKLKKHFRKKNFFLKYRENQRQKLCSDHPQHIKTRKSSQPTKKLDYPVRSQFKKITDLQRSL